MFRQTVVGVGEHELPGRGWFIVSGVVSVIAGMVVVAWPFDSIAVLTLAAGIWLVVIGVTEVVQSFLIRREAKDVRHTIEAVTRPVAA